MQVEQKLTLKIPSGEKVRLTVGNSIYGKQPWRGDIYGLAFYNYPLSSDEATSHFNRWSIDRNFSFASKENPSLLYVFGEKAGTKVHDNSGGKHHLEIPSRMRVFGRKILTLTAVEFMSRSALIKDIVINFLGFMPFGFVLFATLNRSGGGFDKHAFLYTVVSCFLVSLSIEILQSWIPSRSSNILDLALNTLGGLTGAAICWSFKKVQGSRFRFEG